MFMLYSARRPRVPLYVRQGVIANLLLYPADVCRVHLVPGRHVLLHALFHARLLAARQGAAGLGNAPLEALLVDVLAGG